MKTPTAEALMQAIEEGLQRCVAEYTENAGPVAMALGAGKCIALEQVKERARAIDAAKPEADQPPTMAALKQSVADSGEIIETMARNADQLEAEIERLKDEGRDAARLDSGCIMIDTRDEFGEPVRIEHRGMDLRKAIDAAMEQTKGVAIPDGQ